MPPNLPIGVRAAETMKTWPLAPLKPFAPFSLFMRINVTTGVVTARSRWLVADGARSVHLLSAVAVAQVERAAAHRPLRAFWSAVRSWPSNVPTSPRTPSSSTRGPDGDPVAVDAVLTAEAVAAAEAFHRPVGQERHRCRDPDRDVTTASVAVVDEVTFHGPSTVPAPPHRR